MCGHVGVAGLITHKEEKLFKQGLIVDSLRGEHSTGVLAVYKGADEPSIAKQVGNPFELFNDKRFDKTMLRSKRVLLGHNRYATMGAVNKYNAHPFQFNHIYGAHNGTLRSWYDLEGYKDFQVDSQALFHHISLHGVESAVGSVTGAWALVWWDEKEQELNFLRNDQRTFYIAMNDLGTLLFWASEKEMLQLLLARNQVKHSEIVPLDVDQWVRFPIDKAGNIEKPIVKKVTGKKIIATTTSTIWRGGNHITHINRSSIEQNTTTKPKNIVTTCDHRLIRDNVLMEIGRKQLDIRRAAYVHCTDAENPSVKIRLYLKPGDEFLWRDKFIIVGRIGSFTTEEGGYYKVVHSTVRTGTPQEQITYDEIMGRYDDAEVNPIIETFPDHKGVFLTKAEWEKKYPSCAWCSVDLVAEEKNHISKDGDAVCPDCSENTEVSMYL